MSSGDAAKAFLKALRSPVDAMEYALTLHAVRPLLTAPATLVNLRDFMVRARMRFVAPRRAEDLIRFAKHLPEAEGDLRGRSAHEGARRLALGRCGRRRPRADGPEGHSRCGARSRTEALRAVL